MKGPSVSNGADYSGWPVRRHNPRDTKAPSNNKPDRAVTEAVPSGSNKGISPISFYYKVNRDDEPRHPRTRANVKEAFCLPRRLDVDRINHTIWSLETCERSFII